MSYLTLSDFRKDNFRMEHLATVKPKNKEIGQSFDKVTSILPKLLIFNLPLS